MFHTSFTFYFLLCILVMLICTDYFLLKSKSMKYITFFYFLYSYFFWALVISSGVKFGLDRWTNDDSYIAIFFLPGWLVFFVLYTVKAIKRKIHLGVILTTVSVCIPLMFFTQVWTGFIYTCAGYGDCL